MAQPKLKQINRDFIAWFQSEIATNPRGKDMTKEPTKIKATDKPKLDALTGTTPFVATLHRTPSRDNLKIFTGDNRDKDAETFATLIAARNGTVFLLKPVKVFTPPKEPVVEVADLDFS